MNADDRDGVEEVRRKARLSGAADYFDDYDEDQDHDHNMKVSVMITMIIMIQRPFNFLDHFDDFDDGQDHDHNIEGVCDDYYIDHDPKTI